MTRRPSCDPPPIPRFDAAAAWPHLPEHIRISLGMVAIELCIARYGSEVARAEREAELMVGAEDAAMAALDAVVEHYVIDAGLVSRNDPGVPQVAGAICAVCGLAATDDVAALVGFASSTRCWQCTPPEAPITAAADAFRDDS